jgi:pantetheine-phosphate adenylyltransferase
MTLPASSRIAVYPGTFDPVTNGHLDLAERGRRHFDRLVLAILRNEDKQPMFTVDERAALLREAIAPWDNVTVDVFDGLLVNYAQRVGARVILRGVRAITDLEYEMQMAMMNRKLAPQIETVFLVPSEAYSYVSSRLVREVARLGGDVSELVPSHVARALRQRLGPGASAILGG